MALCSKYNASNIAFKKTFVCSPYNFFVALSWIKAHYGLELGLPHFQLCFVQNIISITISPVLKYALKAISPCSKLGVSFQPCQISSRGKRNSSRHGDISLERSTHWADSCVWVMTEHVSGLSERADQKVFWHKHPAGVLMEVFREPARPQVVWGWPHSAGHIASWIGCCGFGFGKLIFKFHIQGIFPLCLLACNPAEEGEILLHC